MMKSSLIKTEEAELRKDWLLKNKKDVVGMSFSQKRELIKEYNSSISSLLEKNNYKPSLEDIERVREGLKLPKRIHLAQAVAFIKTLMSCENDEYKEKYSEYCKNSFSLDDMRKIMMFDNDVKATRIDTDIYHQTHETNRSIVEVVSNAIDALNKKGYTIGRFGVGFYQTLSHLKSSDDKVIVTTGNSSTGYYKIFFRNFNGDIQVHIESLGNQIASGTTVELQSKHFDRTDAEALVKKHLLYNETAKVYLNNEFINNLEHLGHKQDDLPQVHIQITDTGYIVQDNGIGMGPEIILEKLLIPKVSGKKPIYEIDSSIVPTPGYMIEKQSPEKNGGKVSLQVGGILIEEMSVPGINNVRNLIIDLPPFTLLGEERSSISVDGTTIQAFKNLMNELFLTQQYDIINTLSYSVEILQKRSTDAKKENNLVHYMKEMAEKHLDASLFYLPNVGGFERVIGENIVLLNPNIKTTHINRIPFVQSIELSGDGLPIYITNLKPDSERLFILTKDFALLDKSIYEKYKSDPTLLNLYIKRLTEGLGKEAEKEIRLRTVKKQEKIEKEEGKEKLLATSFADFMRKNYKEFGIQTEETAQFMYDTLESSRKIKASLIYDNFIALGAHAISIKLITGLFAGYLDHFTHQDILNRGKLKDNKELLQILDTFNTRLFMSNELVYEEFPGKQIKSINNPYGKDILSVEYGVGDINVMPDGTHIRGKIQKISRGILIILHNDNESLSFFDLKENKPLESNVQIYGLGKNDRYGGGNKIEGRDYGITEFEGKKYFFQAIGFGISGGNIDPSFLFMKNGKKIEKVIYDVENRGNGFGSNSCDLLLYDIETGKNIILYPELGNPWGIVEEGIVFSKFQGTIPNRLKKEEYIKGGKSDKEKINRVYFSANDVEREEMKWQYTLLDKDGIQCPLSVSNSWGKLLHDNIEIINGSHESFSKGLEIKLDMEKEKIEIWKDGKYILGHDISKTEYKSNLNKNKWNIHNNRLDIDTLEIDGKQYYSLYVNLDKEPTGKILHQYLFDSDCNLLGDFMKEGVFVNMSKIYSGELGKISYKNNFKIQEYFKDVPGDIQFEEICHFLYATNGDNNVKKNETYFIPYKGNKDEKIPVGIPQLLKNNESVFMYDSNVKKTPGYEILESLKKITNWKFKFFFQSKPHYSRGNKTEIFQIYDQNNNLIDDKYYDGIFYDEEKKCFILSSISYYSVYNNSNHNYGCRLGNPKTKFFKEYTKEQYNGGTFRVQEEIIQDVALYVSENGNILGYKEIEDMVTDNRSFPSFYNPASMEIDKITDGYFFRGYFYSFDSFEVIREVKKILALGNNIHSLNDRKLHDIQHLLEYYHNCDQKQIERFISRCFRYADLEDRIFENILPLFLHSEYINNFLIKSDIIDHIGGLLKNYDESNSLRFWKFLSKLISDKDEFKDTSFIDKFYKVFCDKFIYINDKDKADIFSTFDSLREYNNGDLYTGWEIVRNNIQVPLEQINEKIRPIIFYLLEDTKQNLTNNSHEPIEFSDAYEIRLSSLIQTKRLSEQHIQNIAGGIKELSELIHTKNHGRKVDHIQREIIHPIYYQNIDNAYLFIRELVQNAHDAVIMDKKGIDKKVDIRIYSKDKNQISVSIEDKVGMNFKEFINYFLVPGESTKISTEEAIGYFGQGLFTLFKGAKEVVIKTSKGDGIINYFKIEPYYDGVGIIIDLNVQMKQEKGTFQGSWIEKTMDADFPEVESAYIQNSIYSYTGLVDAGIIDIYLNDTMVNKPMEVLSTQNIPDIGILKLYNAPNNVITQRGLYIKSIDAEYKTKLNDVEALLDKKGYVISIPDKIVLTRSRNDIAQKKETIEQIQKYLPSLKLNAYLEIFRQDIIKGHVIQLDNLPYDYFYAPITSNAQIRKDAQSLIEGKAIEYSDLYLNKGSLIELLVLLPVVEINNIYYSMEQLVKAYLNNETPLDNEQNLRQVPSLIREKLLKGKQDKQQHDSAYREQSEKGNIVGDFSLENLHSQPEFIQSKINAQKLSYENLDKFSKVLNTIAGNIFNKNVDITFYQEPNSIAHASPFGFLGRNLNYRSGWKMNRFTETILKDFERFEEFYDVWSHEYAHIIENSSSTHNESFYKMQAKALSVIIDYFSKEDSEI